MKHWAVAMVVLSGTAASSAQVVTPIQTTLRFAFEKRIFRRSDQQLPTRPSQPRDIEAIGQLPESGEAETDLKIVRSGTTRRRGDELELSDGVELIYRGYRIFANRVDGNLKTEIFALRGDVTLLGKDAVVTGETVTVDFKQRTYNTTFGKSQIKPSLLPDRVKGDVFVTGRQTFGNTKKLQAIECDLTTCERKEPHFHFEARKAEVEPDRQVLMRDVKLYLFKKEILRLPYLWIPLGDRGYKYLPQVGQSPDEGYYVKNRYGFPMNGDDRGALRLDYMERIGTGVGGEYFYRNSTLNGIARVYAINGANRTTTWSSQHEQRLKAGTLTLDNDVQQNNYLTAPGSTLVNTRAQFLLNQPDTGTTTLGYFRQSNESADVQTSTQTYTLTDARRFGPRTNTNLDLSLASSASSFGGSNTRRETLDVRFRGQHELPIATASLEYQRTIPVGNIDNFFSGSDRTPVVSLASDSRRLFNWKNDPVPLRTEFTLGEYLDAVSRDNIGRGSFDLSFNRASRNKGPWRLDTNGRYFQTVYSDDTAQYQLNFGSALRYDLGRQFNLNLRYSYLRPYGYSPLAIDRSGQNNVVTFDASAKPNKEVTLGLQTGYDIIRLDRRETPWQQVGVRAEYALGQAYSLRTLTTYDTFRGAWSNIRIDSTWQWGSGSRIAFGTRYDGFQQVWSNFNAYIDGITYGRTTLSAALSYNGFSKQFDIQQYNFVYDLHCADAVLTWSEYGTGFRGGREIAFFIRFKALPSDSAFGFGRRGQGVGIGTGRDF